MIRHQDALDIVDAVKSEFPYWHSRASTVGRPGQTAPAAAPCGRWNLEELFGCLVANCSTELTSSFSSALNCDKCSSQVWRLRQECFNCFDWKIFSANLDSSNCKFECIV